LPLNALIFTHFEPVELLPAHVVLHFAPVTVDTTVTLVPLVMLFLIVALVDALVRMFTPPHAAAIVVVVGVGAGVAVGTGVGVAVGAGAGVAVGAGVGVAVGVGVGSGVGVAVSSGVGVAEAGSMVAALNRPVAP
jgi:hypothetical protein